MTINPIGLRGIEFVEFASRDPEALHRLFVELGFSRVMRHRERPVDLYRQGDIHFLLNRAPQSFAASFEKAHGPSISAMGWRVDKPLWAEHEAVARGAVRGEGDYTLHGEPMPAVVGIGGSLVYLTPVWGNELYVSMGFVNLPEGEAVIVPEKGFLAIDHLTNNVEKGTMDRWARFYKDVFGFTEVRYFDIRGAKTGLTSYALRSPCGSFCIPINEGSEAKSQINEYLEEYKGPGIQHLAFLTRDILASLRALEGSKSIGFLDMDAKYYGELWPRFEKMVSEDHAEIERRNVLVDGDEKGYLLQIFTRNLVGPIFVEIIQRNNHDAFGEGNFGALFRSIERDQVKRGYLTA